MNHIVSIPPIMRFWCRTSFLHLTTIFAEISRSRCVCFAQSYNTIANFLSIVLRYSGTLSGWNISSLASGLLSGAIHSYTLLSDRPLATSVAFITRWVHSGTSSIAGKFLGILIVVASFGWPPPPVVNFRRRPIVRLASSESVSDPPDP